MFKLRKIDRAILHFFSVITIIIGILITLNLSGYFTDGYFGWVMIVLAGISIFAPKKFLIYYSLVSAPLQYLTYQQLRHSFQTGQYFEFSFILLVLSIGTAIFIPLLLPVENIKWTSLNY